MPRPLLTSPLQLRSVRLRNRVVLSPMCMYAAQDGKANDWHFAHLASFALGGTAVVFTEATAVEPDGRISHADLGLWSRDHVDSFRRITGFLDQAGAVAGIQLAHAGRKASTQQPWDGFGPLTAADGSRGEPPWPVKGPSPIAAGTGYPVPAELDRADLARLAECWGAAAERAAEAGFRALELHGGHGYLLHSFLSPIANRRGDGYGGDREARMRFPLEIVEAVRRRWPAELPLFYRLSSVDGIDGGWEIEDSVAFAKELKIRGVDVVDCSSGGVVTQPPAVRSQSHRAIPRGLGFQVGYAGQIRQDAEVPTMAVGLIVDPHQAEAVLASGAADLVALGRELLFSPSWAAGAAVALGGARD